MRISFSTKVILVLVLWFSGLLLVISTFAQKFFFEEFIEDPLGNLGIVYLLVSAIIAFLFILYLHLYEFPISDNKKLSFLIIFGLVVPLAFVFATPIFFVILLFSGFLGHKSSIISYLIVGFLCLFISYTFRTVSRLFLKRDNENQAPNPSSLWLLGLLENWPLYLSVYHLLFGIEFSLF